MRLYIAGDEQRIRMQAHLREWVRAGFVQPAQGAAIDPQLRTGLRRTHDLLRSALGLFTAIIVAASVWLLFESFHIRDGRPTAITLALAGGASIALAEYLVAAFRLYRHGVEEALAVAAVVLLAFSAAEAARASGLGTYREWTMASLLAASLAGVGVYRRYGLVYSAVGAMVCAALVPFQFHVTDAVQRSLAAVVFGAAFAVTRAAHLRYGDDFPGDDYAKLQAAACAGVYLVLNLHLTDAISWTPGAPPVATPFYWTSYAATWLVPAAALAAAVREKDRPLLTVGIVLALCTLVTNKPYLGWTRQSWDPMILGVLLAGGALALRRWLDAGPNSQRGGFTAAPILTRDRDILSALATASVAWHARGHEPPPHDAPPSDFAGGRSGGAGGGAGY